MSDSTSHPVPLSRDAEIPGVGRVCRLGLATRGNTHLTADDVLRAIDRGINYLNWCGHPDGMRDAIRRLGEGRRDVCIAVQLEARTAVAARSELAAFLDELQTDFLDVVTCYHVEHPDEWAEIAGPGGAAEALEEARRAGTVRAIGLTSHQRPVAALAAESGRLDLLMIRYNAAHRRAEQEIFPITTARAMPVIAFTCLRWGALLRPTPDDPPGYQVPAAPEWYRYVLSHPAVSVALAAPNGAAELDEDLTLLDDWRGLSAAEREAMERHGARVRAHAGQFP